MSRNTSSSSFRNWMFLIKPEVDQVPAFKTERMKFLKWQWNRSADSPLGKEIVGVCIYVYGVRESKVKNDMPRGDISIQVLPTASDARGVDLGADSILDGPFQEVPSSMGDGAVKTLPSFSTEQEALKLFETHIKTYGWSYSMLYLQCPSLVKQHSEYVKELIEESKIESSNRILPATLFLSIPQDLKFDKGVIDFGKQLNMSTGFYNCYEDLINDYRGEAMICFRDFLKQTDDMNCFLDLVTSIKIIKSNSGKSITNGVKFITFVELLGDEEDSTEIISEISNKLLSILLCEVRFYFESGLSKCCFVNYYLDSENCKRVMQFESEHETIESMTRLFGVVMKSIQPFEAIRLSRRYSFNSGCKYLKESSEEYII